MIIGDFSFHPVGQGLFYTGHIMDVKDNCSLCNFIYDIGSDRQYQSFLHNEIESFTDQLNSLEHKDIDFLVLSHFDYDHISGLQYLAGIVKQKNINIKNIIVPYISSLNIIYVAIATFFDAKLISIYSDNINSWNDELKDDLGLFSYDRSKNIIFINDIWQFAFVYKPLNLPIYNDYINELKNKLYDKKLFDIKASGVDDFLRQLLQNINPIADEIKKIKQDLKTDPDKNSVWKKITTDNNPDSLIMLHGPLHIYLNAEYSLLTGDSNWKDEKYQVWLLDNFVNKHINYYQLKYFQIPHHGSQRNWMTYTDNFYNQPISPLEKYLKGSKGCNTFFLSGFFLTRVLSIHFCELFFNFEKILKCILNNFIKIPK